MPFTAPLIDLSKIRPGDEVTVMARVVKVRPDHLVDCVTDDGEPDGFCIRPKAIVSHTPAVREFKVGDRVEMPDEKRGTLRAIYEHVGWVENDCQGWSSLALSTLRHVEDETGETK